MQSSVIRTIFLIIAFGLSGYLHGENVNSGIVQKYHVFFGTSIPLGDFASHGASYRNCYAENGFLFGLEGAYYLRPEAHVGMLISASFIFNPFDIPSTIWRGTWQ